MVAPPPTSTLFPYTTLFRSLSRAQPYISDPGVVSSSPVSSHVFRPERDRKSTRLNSSHVASSYAVFCLKKKNHTNVREYLNHEEAEETADTLIALVLAYGKV